MNSQQLAERMKTDIIADAMIRRVPHTVRTFDQLHEFVDPNCYGGADELFGEMVTESGTDHEHQAKIDAFSAIRDPAIRIVDDWLKAGGIEATLTPHRITVWRPKTMIGLGAPQAFLLDECPTKGDWHQSAKAYLLDSDPHLRLHQMGRDFLIYSMYRAREPYYLGLAVENFGAACKTLGYSLPLKETDAVWLTCTANELAPAPQDEQQFLLGHIASVFGSEAAKAQAEALRIAWPARIGPRSIGSTSPQR